MQIVERSRDKTIGLFSFLDDSGEREFLLDSTQVSYRAGCHCQGEQLVCYNAGYLLFNPDRYHYYQEDYMQAFACFMEDLQTSESETDSISSSTYSSADSDKTD